MASCSTKPRRLRRLVLSERVRPSRVPRVPNRQRASVPDCASDAQPESPSPAFRDLRTFSPCEPSARLSERPIPRDSPPPVELRIPVARRRSLLSPVAINRSHEPRACVRLTRASPRSGRAGSPHGLVSEAGSRFRREYPFEFPRQSVRPASRTCHRRKPQPPDEQRAGLFCEPSLVTLAGRSLLSQSGR